MNCEGVNPSSFTHLVQPLKSPELKMIYSSHREKVSVLSKSHLTLQPHEHIFIQAAWPISIVLTLQLPLNIKMLHKTDNQDTKFNELEANKINHSNRQHNN